MTERERDLKELGEALLANYLKAEAASRPVKLLCTGSLARSKAGGHTTGFFTMGQDD